MQYKFTNIKPPTGPDWQIDWHVIAAQSFVPAMMQSTQDPISHAEGDVWTHTMMVVESLVADVNWRSLPQERRDALFLAAILHDVAKPQTRIEDNGKIRNPGHSKIGSMDARIIYWMANIPRNIREAACTTIMFHQAPFWLIERPTWKAEWMLAKACLDGHIEDIATHAQADTLGRICPDQENMLDCIGLFELMGQEMDTVYSGENLFYNDHARVRYFADPENKNFRDCPPDISSGDFEVVVMSGLPGSGKSTLAEQIAGNRNIPILSLDVLRFDLKIKPEDNQGVLIQHAQERAREFLRRKQSFIWDSTNLSVDQRSRVLSLAHAYGARSHIVSVERPYEDTMESNRNREAAVPQAVINRMLKKWEPPTLAECYSMTIETLKKKKSFQFNRR